MPTMLGNCWFCSTGVNEINLFPVRLQGVTSSEELFKWPLFAPSVRDFIFELPCTSVESSHPGQEEMAPAIAMEYGAIDGPVVVDKGYRLANFSVYCRR